MSTSNVHDALHALAQRLKRAGIPYAVVGAMALGRHGYVRATADIGVILHPDGLAAFKTRYLGRGYVEKFKGSRGVRDAVNNVPIDVLLTGEYPGDGLPKPITIPDPAVCATEVDGVAYIHLETLVALKLASGMTAPHRLRDLADVQELIRWANLSRDLAAKLNPHVRDKYLELWGALDAAPADEH